MVQNNRKFFVIFCVIFAIMILDSTVLRIYQFVLPPNAFENGTVYFLFIVVASIMGQCIIIQFVRSKFLLTKRAPNKDLKFLLRLFLPTQSILIGMLLTVVFQISTITAYNSLLLKLTVLLGYTQSICIIAFLIYKFASWLKTNRDHTVTLYLLAFISLSVNLLFTLVYVTDIFASYPPYINPNPGGYVPFSNPNSVLSFGFHVTSIASYIFMWIATAILLKNNTRRLGRVKYWTLVTIPLIYFLIQFQPVILQILFPLRLDDPVIFGFIYTVFFNISRNIGGILFGIGFWSIGTKLGKGPLRDFMIISAYGLVLFFASNQAILLISTAFPPFGISSICFIGIASYLVLVGIYSSAISIAQDVNVRKAIRKSLEEQTNLMYRIASSEMEQRIASNVINSAKKISKEMEKDTGLEGSFEESEMKSYVAEIIKEMKKNKKN